MQNEEDQPPLPRAAGGDRNRTEEVDPFKTFNGYRPLLFSIAYRMLGSVADAEDMVQEAFLRWQRTSRVDVQSPRAFLVTIISRLCINHLGSARAKREEYVGQWLPEPVITGPDTNPFSLLHIDESVSMAFLVVLERLTPVERAVFLLREVFDCEFFEIGKALGKDEANCRQILRRARQHVAEVRTRFDTSPEQKEKLLARFLHATSTGNLDELVAMLSADAVLYSDGGGKGPAIPNLIHGADHVGKALLGGIRKLVPHDLTSRVVQINGQPGIVSYCEGRPFAVVTLDIRQARIRSVYIISNPEKLAHLPFLPGAPN
jgi:RNA polymerase sigma-70 factor, ECF subfamily